MTKILGYTNGEISRLYIMSTSIVVILCLLISLPIEATVMEVLFREMMLQSISGWIALWIDPMIYVQMFAAGFVTYGIVALLEYRRIRESSYGRKLSKMQNKLELKFALHIVKALIAVIIKGRNCSRKRIPFCRI